MAYLGYIDEISGHTVRGWVWNSDQPDLPLDVEIYSDDRLIGLIAADLYRADLFHSNFGNGRHAFEYSVGESEWKEGRISARVAGSTYLLTYDHKHKESIFHESFMQSVMQGMPNAPYAFSKQTVSAIDRQVASEIIEFFQEAEAKHKTPSAFIGSNNMWEIHKTTRQDEIIRLLEGGDVENVAQYFCDLPEKRLSDLFLQGELSTKGLRSANPAGLHQIAAFMLDPLVSIAEYLAVSFMESAEQGVAGAAIFSDPGELIHKINDRLGFNITPPNVLNGLFGLEVEGCVFNRRHLHGLYTALKVRDSLPSSSRLSVAELGAGGAFSTYYAMRLGINRYTLFDLPIMCLVQYYMLRKALPKKQVAFAGRSEVGSNPDIVIAPAPMFGDQSLGHFDLVVNVDSLPEMGDAVSNAYIDAMPAVSKRFLSINQEAGRPLTDNPNGPFQSIVPKLVSGRKQYALLSRNRSWIRHGYAEELYQIQ